MNKSELIQHLQNNTYVRLKPSGIHGVGVFAIREIPKGCDSFFSTVQDEWIYLSYTEVGQLPIAIQNLIETYCLFDDNGYFVPSHGFEKMDLSLFLNHSDRPNVASIEDGERFIALMDIKEGEELFVDYGTIVDSPE